MPPFFSLVGQFLLLIVLCLVSARITHLEPNEDEKGTLYCVLWIALVVAILNITRHLGNF